MSGLVDWELAGRVARAAAGDGPASMASAPRLEDAAERGEGAVLAYTRLEPQEPVPRAEWVSRREWAEANLASMRGPIGLLEERIAETRADAGKGAMGAVAGRIIALEIGGVVGLASRRVLGQYEFPILGEGTPRLLFVGQNIESAAGELSADPVELLDWIATHEITHAVHFAAAPWLRGHLSSLARTLLAEAPLRIEARDILAGARGLANDPRKLLADLREGDPITLLAPPQSRETIATVQATMAAIEGFAEHVMDVAASELGLAVEELRAGIDRRREGRSTFARVLSWLLGFEMKLRQYREGKRFCDEVVARAGIEELNRAWRGAAELPSAAELASAEAWLARVGSASIAA